jgi:hypothetical protein
MCSMRKTEHQGEVLLPKVALRKRRDKTNFDGQADNCLANGATNIESVVESTNQSLPALFMVPVCRHWHGHARHVHGC